MNDADIEQNLRELLRPVEPAADLRRRIQKELRANAAQPRALAGRLPSASTPGLLFRLLRDFGWACAGAAAVLAILAGLPGKHVIAPALKTTVAVNETQPAAATTPTATATFEHDETTHELVSTVNSDQLVQTDDGPAQEVRYSYVERNAWSDPRTGATVILEVPREDVYLLPVSLE